jgi:ppGpp synthetase/RelA/SpoT-type nucleotidyltranferase
MKQRALTRTERLKVNELIELFEKNKPDIEYFLSQLKVMFEGNPALKPYVHSIKSRVKDPVRLRDKLRRKVLKARRDGKTFDITVENFFQEGK